MPNLIKHLDSNEQLLLEFRPSRKAYLFQYIFFLLVLVVALIVYSYVQFGISAWYGIPLELLAGILFLYAVVMLIRLEYRIYSRKYGITTERILYSRGIFSETFRSIQYAAITDVGMQQSLFDKIMNTGTLKIDTAGTGNYEIRYRKINDPVGVKKRINDLCPQKKNVQKSVVS